MAFSLTEIVIRVNRCRTGVMCREGLVFLDVNEKGEGMCLGKI